MKFISLVTSALLAVSVSARYVSTSSSDVVAIDEDLSVPGDNPLQHCEDPKDDILKVTKVDLSPNPPKPGQNLTFTAVGTLSDDVKEGAYASLTVKYGLITIIKQTADLCDTVANVGLECPLKKGDLKLTKDVAIPQRVPPGKYTVLADVYTVDDDKITCLSATVEFHLNGMGGGLFKQGL